VDRTIKLGFYSLILSYLSLSSIALEEEKTVISWQLSLFFEWINSKEVF